jgi:hypothetical protein
LGRSGKKQALELLLELLLDIRRGDVERALAAEALGQLGYRESGDALRRCVDAKRSELEWEEWPVLLICSAVALAKLGDHGACDAVLDALRSVMPTARSLAADGLRIVTGPGALDALAAAVHDRSREVRRAVIEALFLYGTVGAVEALIVACDDEVDDVALQALLRFGDVVGVTLADDDGAEEAGAVWAKHRNDFAPGICHRHGRPFRISDLLADLHNRPPRQADLIAELTVVTGLPIEDLLRGGGMDAVAERLPAVQYPAGGFYKWGLRQPLS